MTGRPIMPGFWDQSNVDVGWPWPNDRTPASLTIVTVYALEAALPAGTGANDLVSAEATAIG
jgi:hypothetical protein